MAAKQNGDGKAKRGFASMSREKRLEIARRGGAAVPPEKRYFSQDKAAAAAAGKKGGLRSPGRKARGEAE